MRRRPLCFTAISLAAIVLVTRSGTARSKDSQGAERVKEMEFEVLSIRPTSPDEGHRAGVRITPNGFTWTARIWDVLDLAYVGEDVVAWRQTPIVNCPNLCEETYDFNARVSQADLNAWQSQKHSELLRIALRAALRDRCKVAIHEEPQQGDNFELRIAKYGPKLKPAGQRSTLPAGVTLLSGGVMVAFGQNRSSWNFYDATMEDLARFLSMERPVRDKPVSPAVTTSHSK